jgi:hypothetical protein
MSTGITHVRAEEFSDLRTYGAPDVLRHVMGFGGTPESAIRASASGNAIPAQSCAHLYIGIPSTETIQSRSVQRCLR